jgi:hypothetical protein
VTEDTYYGHFEVEFKNYWTNGSYYCILTGLGRQPKRILPLLAHRPENQVRAEELFANIRTRANRLKQITPTNYEFLRRLHNGELIFSDDGSRSKRRANTVTSVVQREENLEPELCGLSA